MGVSSRNHPERSRRICCHDEERNRCPAFLMNNFSRPSHDRATVQMPMQMGIFFKWIKQNLRIKVFYGTSLTAVKTRIWSAISVYVPIAIGKKWLNLDKDLYTILQVLGQTLFEIPLCCR